MRVTEKIIKQTSDKQKRDKYIELVEDVRRTYEGGNIRGTINGKEFTFEWCDLCKDEINLWTYWQGAGNLSPKVLVVGQDWGQVIESDPCVQNIREGRFCFHDVDKPRFDTDKNLAELIHRINDTWKPFEEPCDGLFFTNFILGYRNTASSGGKAASWIKPKIREHFYKLANILEPKIILCLGRITFNEVVMTLTGQKPPKGSWADVIDNGPIECKLNNKSNGTTCLIFPLPHPGKYGVLNYRRSIKNNKDLSDVDVLYKAWEKIPKYFDK